MTKSGILNAKNGVLNANLGILELKFIYEMGIIYLLSEIKSSTMNALTKLEIDFVSIFIQFLVSI